MKLIPILEIRHAKSVHIEYDASNESHVVSEDPMESVAKWDKKGIRRIYFFDVDAVESGEPCNVNILRKIKTKYPHIIIQVIGGIKCLDSAFI